MTQKTEISELVYLSARQSCVMPLETKESWRDTSNRDRHRTFSIASHKSGRHHMICAELRKRREAEKGPICRPTTYRFCLVQ